MAGGAGSTKACAHRGLSPAQCLWARPPAGCAPAAEARTPASSGEPGPGPVGGTARCHDLGPGVGRSSLHPSMAAQAGGIRASEA